MSVKPDALFTQQRFSRGATVKIFTKVPPYRDYCRVFGVGEGGRGKIASGRAFMGVGVPKFILKKYRLKRLKMGFFMPKFYFFKPNFQSEMCGGHP